MRAATTPPFNTRLVSLILVVPWLSMHGHTLEKARAKARLNDKARFQWTRGTRGWEVFVDDAPEIGTSSPRFEL